VAQDTVTPEPVTQPGVDPNWPRETDVRLNRIADAEMEIAVLLGRTRMPLEAVLNAEPGTVYELKKMAGLPMEILVNGTLFGYGEIVVVGDRLAVRIVQLLKPGEMKDF
jgi:flagellar motor switch protein FliN/FliY